MIKLFPAMIEETFMLSANVKHFILHAEHTPPFNFIPGQFITIHFTHEGKSLKRSYSIANSPSLDNRIEFAAGYVEEGPGSRFLFNLAPKDTITISGPYGRLILKDTCPKRYILAATSTGITPYRAMLEELRKRLTNESSLKVLIILGVQRHADLLYTEDFNQFVQQFPQQVYFRAQLSRASTDELNKNEFKGYVQHALKEITLNPEEDTVYLCGNPGMIDESFQLLKEQGFGLQQIVREKYISGASSAS
jgi:NAD(P)H-flavin reductase